MPSPLKTQWFKNIEMIANPSKFQLTFLSKYKNLQNVQKNKSFDGKTIKSSDTAELLEISLDESIDFKRHIQNICHKASNNTEAIFPYKKIPKF